MSTIISKPDRRSRRAAGLLRRRRVRPAVERFEARTLLAAQALPLALPVAAVVNAAAASQIAYTQPPSPAGGVMKSSWYPPDGLDGDQYVYDSFVLGATQSVTEIDWRGGYTNFLSGAGKSPVFDFTISIYGSIAAGIQPDVVHPPLAQYTVGGNAGETPAGSIGGIPLYDYKFTLPTPFQATAGTKYWVQIEASQGVTPFYAWPPDWGLTTGTGGDGQHFIAITGGTNGGGTLFGTRSGDTAFTLWTTSAATASITASASPAGGGTISGTGAYAVGSTATVVATPNTGFAFVNWTENGTPVSTSASYSFTANADRALMANFAQAFTVTTSAQPGTPQATKVNTAFAAPLQATVLDATGNPMAGVAVTFAAPASGASGRFNGNLVAWTATTDAQGNATTPAFTANTQAGNYVVTASVVGSPSTASFNLTNTPDAPALVAATAGTPQAAMVGTSFTTSLQATVTDSFGNPVPGVSVTFNAPTTGASGTFVGGLTAVTVTTGAQGQASAPAFAANAKVGTYLVTANVAGVTGVAASFSLTNNSTFAVTAISPADGSYASALPGGQVTITFSHPIAGLTDGGPALGPNDPYGVWLAPRGPEGVFAAASGIDSGTLPLHANTLYHANADGTSSITIKPLVPLSTDIYLVQIDLSKFTDTTGNPLTDPLQGFHTFLLQLPPVSSAPLSVTKVTEYNGYATINNNAIYQPDSIAIAFNEPLWPGAAGGGRVQLIANPGPNFTVVPSVATYSPTSRSIYLTPQAALNPGTVYLVRVDASVSDDQGFGGPGHPLGQTFYDSFTVLNSPVGAGHSPLTALTNPDGSLQALPRPRVIWNLPVGYASVAFSEPLNLAPAVFGRWSAMLDPRTVGSDSNQALINVPLSARLAFNPNTNQLIIVPTVPVGNDLYVYSLSNIQATNGDPLTNPAHPGQPLYDTFQLQAAASPQVLTATRLSASAAVVAAPLSASTVPSVTIPGISRPNLAATRLMRFAGRWRASRPLQ